MVSHEGGNDPLGIALIDETDISIKAEATQPELRRRIDPVRQHLRNCCVPATTVKALDANKVIS